MTTHKSPSKLKQRTLTGFIISPESLDSPRRRHGRRVDNPTKLNSTDEDEDSESINKIQFAANRSADAEDEEEEDIFLKPTKRRRINPVESDESETFETAVRAPRKLQKPRNQHHTQDDYEVLSTSPDPPVSSSPPLTRLRRRRSRLSTDSSDHDESDLLDEVDSDRIIPERLRSRGKKSVHGQALENLRRRKAAKGSKDKQLGDKDTSSSDGEVQDTSPFPGSKPSQIASGRRGSHHEDSDASQEDASDSFIVDDDEQAIVATLPTAYSMSTHQDFSHHFKVICQLFVHLALQKPARRADFMARSLADEYFAVPLSIARRKLGGILDSSITSSVWKTSFKRPLQVYPDLTLVHMDFSVPGCHACNLGGRISTLIGRLNGSRYDPMTYESDEESSNNQETTRFEFHLGRFCARRTQSFHAFNHWEYHLYHALKQEVDDLRSDFSTKFVKVGTGGTSKIPGDTNNGDDIMIWLDDRGVIDREYGKIKKLMTAASELESHKGDDRD